MSLHVDGDVQAAALLLQRNFPASKLVSLSQQLSHLAPLLWGRYGQEQVSPVAIYPISSVETEPTAAIQSG